MSAEKLQTWEALLDDAKAQGFVSVGELAEELGIRWDHVLGWLDKAGVDMVDLLPAGARAYRHLANVRQGLGISGRCGVYAPDDEAVEAAYSEWLDHIESENARHNAAAEAEYQRLLQESQDRKAAQERARLAYREWSRAERLKAEEERQARLAASRAFERKRMDIDAAHADVWDLRPKARLAMEQFESTASTRAANAFWISRRGKQNFEYASTNRAIGRKWAQGVAERYAAALARAEEVLEGVTAGRQPYPWDEETLHTLEAGGYVWEADVPEDGTDEAESVTLLRIAFETYDGPVNRKGGAAAPALPRARRYCRTVTRAEIRQAVLSHTQHPAGEHRMSFLNRLGLGFLDPTNELDKIGNAFKDGDPMAALGPIRELFESVEDKLEGIADLFEDETEAAKKTVRREALRAARGEVRKAKTGDRSPAGRDSVTG